MNKILRTGIAAVTVSVLCLGSAPVFAESGSGSGGSTSRHSGEATEVENTSTSTETENETEVHNVTTADKVEATKERVAEAKQKSCDTRKNSVSKIETRVSKRGQARLDAVSRIAARVEAFIKDKDLTVDNYDGLVADINAKQAAAQTAVNAVKDDTGNLGSVTCQNGDGKAKVEAFKKDMKAQQDALKAYRQSVKNLVIAAKAAKTPEGGDQ